ncbi:Golgi SNAP receptor complex member 1-like protein [Absidia repens]|uniref:Golgi SNAP receptor complex member 1 n=1 Tax=Absidia repens TaxID=90262 RepID=A0A1X2IUU2_9FUNG|nr:Golgi SNAP receptor complex member 1-like protein [Absidia repens]
MPRKDTQDEENEFYSPSQPLSWDSLRRQARQVENEIELKLASLSKPGASTTTPREQDQKVVLNGVQENSQAAEVDQLLNSLQDTITSMEKVLDRPSATPTNPSMIHMLERHKNILYDYTKEFRRIKANIKAVRDKAELMSQVQDEIRIFNAGTSDNADYYLTERNRVESSHRLTDMVLDQAYATRQDISRQGRTIHGFNTKVTGIMGRIPGINSIIGRINTRRKRDTLIMAGVVSACIILITMYWLQT